MIKRTAALALTLSTCIAFAACGDPYSERKSFVFTPVAYTPVVAQPSCVPVMCFRGIAQTSEGGDYIADQVWLIVDADAEGRVLDLADRYGFVMIWRSHWERRNETSLLLRVPLGSVFEAAAIFEGQDGVRCAGPNGIGYAQNIAGSSSLPATPTGFSSFAAPVGGC